ncbi:MAG TPA: hypothetical protein VFS11_02410 [Gemmatimonadales bacterium]|nr:hypothetical protein [Gemmatimonadales bacterium]
MRDWTPTAEIDEAVRQWMRDDGFDVTDCFYDEDADVYAWQDARSVPTFTLRISRDALERYSAAELVAALSRDKVAEALRDDPRAYTVLSDHAGALRVSRPGSD